MKIAVAGTRGFPNVQGGVETHCEHLYTRLAPYKCDITLFARAPYVNYRETMYEGVKLIALECPKNKYMEAIVHTIKAVLKASALKPDILHIQSIGPSLFTPLARILGMKVVITHHGENYKHSKWGFLARQFLRFCETVGVLSANEIIAISEDIAVLVEDKYGRKATVIPNGVTILTPLETSDALTKFGLEKHKYILAVGRLVPEKGFHDLIEAFDRCGLRGWQLVIVGRADHENSYSIELKEKASRNRNVVMTGFLKGKHLEELYSHAGLFVIPSYYEGLPIVLLEALSYGLSCIASDIPANRNISFLSASRFFETGDISGLAIKLSTFALQCMSDQEKKAQIEMIARDYNWDDIAEKTLMVYEKAVAKNQRFKEHRTC